jgi:hypothetical protein
MGRVKCMDMDGVGLGLGLGIASCSPPQACFVERSANAMKRSVIVNSC